MANFHKALVRAQKEHNRNYLEPIKKETKVPVVFKKEHGELVADWVVELEAKIRGDSKVNEKKIILFTGASEKCGCSKLAIDYSKSIADYYKKRVLLIDLTRENLGKNEFVKSKNIFFIDDFLSIDVSVANNNESKSGMLYILSFSKKVNGNQLRIESSGKLKEILDTAKENFDYVFIGSPPITKFPGAINLAGQADGTILIIDFGKTRKQVAQKAKKNIEESNGKFIGTIINRRKYYIPEFLYKFI